MQKNIHRRVLRRKDFFAGRDTSVLFNAPDLATWHYVREDILPQQFDCRVLNDLNQGKGEQERCGRSVFAKELRLRLNLRSMVPQQKTAIIAQAFNTQSGLTDNPRNVRNYVMRLNQAAVELGGHSFTGSITGVDAVAEEDAVIAEIGSQGITANNADGVIKIDDTHPNQPGGSYAGTTNTVNNTVWSQNYAHEVVPIFQVRILIVKYYEMVIPDDRLDKNLALYFLPNNEDLTPDIYGPTGPIQTDYPIPSTGEYRLYQYELGGAQYSNISLMAPLLDTVYKKTDILYDKIVTFSPSNPVFTLDEVWKLNETVVWQTADQIPIQNGIVLIMYDEQSSMRVPYNSALNYKHIPYSNNLFLEMSSEFYYTQPE